ncbi:hypothetical protein JXQ70_12205 [bacterium]|nr:hypothetical protein [bacterium]
MHAHLKKHYPPELYILTGLCLCCLCGAGYVLYMAWSHDSYPKLESGQTVSGPTRNNRSHEKSETPLPTLIEDTQDPLAELDREDLGWQLALDRSRSRQKDRERQFSQDQTEANDNTDGSSGLGPGTITHDSEETKAFLQAARSAWQKLKQGVDRCTRIAARLPTWQAGLTEPFDSGHFRLRELQQLNMQQHEIEEILAELPEPPHGYETIRTSLEQLYETYVSFCSFIKHHPHMNRAGRDECNTLIDEADQLSETIQTLFVAASQTEKNNPTPAEAP